ncbi:MAG TPA: homoserine dehydrogenase [Clostridia bacterium]|nr:homoserine dehydrogenase [Clostridia bacterium]
MKKIGVALLGLGTVGGGTYEILTKNRDYFKETQNVDIEVKQVLEKNTKRCEEFGVDLSIVSTDIEKVINNPEIQIVAEFFGGIEPARTFLIKALESGKSIVTANKELFSKHWQELEFAAKKGNAGLYFEASCVGGVPIIRTLTDSMQANHIIEMKGIINGTTNYILSSMTESGTAYDDALKSAQALGFAEFNPTADVDGFDASYKISILSSLAYHKRVPLEKVYREGISNISVNDIAIGKELGMTLKLLAISKCINGKIEARVHPAFVPSTHPLASVSGAFNAVFLKGDSVGDIMLYGAGAGALPTGSAIVSDIIFAAQKEIPPRYAYMEKTEVDDNDFLSDFTSKYYVRINANDEEGTLGKIANVFGKNNINLVSVIQRNSSKLHIVPIVFVTSETKESKMQRAIAEIKKLAGVESIRALIRVEED